MKITTEQTVTLTITLTSTEAASVCRDFDQRREPSQPGKAVYEALRRVAKDHDDHLRAAFGMEPVKNEATP